MAKNQQLSWLLRAIMAAIFVLVLMGVPRGLHPNTNMEISHQRAPLNLSTLLYDAKDTEQRTMITEDIKREFPLFKAKKFVIWNNDLHSSPIEDLKHLLSPMGVKFIHFAMDSRCDKYFSGCRDSKDIQVLNRTNILEMDNHIIQQFYNAYKDDPEMRSVDAFVCYHPPPLCELFLPFNRSILVVASTRYAGARPETDRWVTWNHRLRRLSRSPKHIVAANNRYDIEYMKYYSGVSGELLPSFCGYTNATYQPKHNIFLLYAGRYSNTKHAYYFRERWEEACSVQNCSGLDVVHLKDAFSGHHSYQDVASYKGIIHIPYQVSTMSLFEHYRMAIPLFFPSLELLASLDREKDFVNERNCKDFRKCYADSPFASIPKYPGRDSVPDPHNKTDIEAIKYWLRFSDFYQWPHITYFDSMQDLLQKLASVDLGDISRRMRDYNKHLEALLLTKWKEILMKLSHFSPNQPR